MKRKKIYDALIILDLTSELRDKLKAEAKKQTIEKKRYVSMASVVRSAIEWLINNKHDN